MMHPFRIRLLGIMGVALTASSLWAQAALPAADAQPAKDPIVEAVNTLRSIGEQDAPTSRFLMDLDSARKLLVQQRERSLPLVMPLLNENDVLVRINGAMILASMAREGAVSPELHEALKRCLQDSNPGVAQWGLMGLTAEQLPMQERLAAIRQALALRQPRALRMSALQAAGSTKLKEAIPILAAHLQQVLPEYTQQVDELMTLEVEDATLGRMPETREAPEPTPGMRGRGRGAGSVPDAPPPVQKRRIKRDPDNLPIQEREALIPRTQNLPAVIELHQAGVLMEELIRGAYPGTPPFEFVTTPPWGLAQCVTKAGAWLKEHEQEFKPVAPAAPAAAPVTPAAETGAGTAPAATEAAP